MPQCLRRFDNRSSSPRLCQQHDYFDKLMADASTRTTRFYKRYIVVLIVVLAIAPTSVSSFSSSWSPHCDKLHVPMMSHHAQISRPGQQRKGTVMMTPSSTTIHAALPFIMLPPPHERRHWQPHHFDARNSLSARWCSASVVMRAATPAAAAAATPAEEQSIDNNNNNNNNVDHHEETVEYTRRIWPCMDTLDRRLIAIALPVMANFAIGPLIGAVDLFWVNRMGNALAVAGQAAANQVFNSVFWLTSFLPSVTATLISKENAKGNKDGVQDAVCQALFIGICMALISTILLLYSPDRALSSVLPAGAPALQYAKPYFLIRSFAFIPALISLVGFSSFRGVLDTVTPVKISAFANIFNAILDPILIFPCAMGVTGAALATLAAEVISATVYLYLLQKRGMIQLGKIFQIPKWARLEPLLRGGAALQLRAVALNVSFLAVARVTQSIDQTGVAAAAHAMAIQVFQVGGIALLALSTVAQTIVPNDLVERYDDKLGKRVGGLRYAKASVNRLMAWGALLGVTLGSLQLALLPLIRQSTPIQAVRDAALIPAIFASGLQLLNSLVFIGEGVMVGTGNFLQLSLSTIIATVGILWALQTFPATYGLTGVWMGFAVFNVLRLLGVALHQFVTSPFAPKKLRTV